MEETKIVESSDTTQNTEAEGTKIPVTSQEDPETLIRVKNEEIARVTKERDDFKRGMFKYKNRSRQEARQDDGEEVDDLDERIDRKIQEALLDSNVAKAQAEKDALIAKQARELKELKIAIGNKSQISNAPGGSSQESSEIKKSSYGWSSDQIKDLKSRHPEWTDSDFQKAWINYQVKIKSNN